MSVMTRHEIDAAVTPIHSRERELWQAVVVKAVIDATATGYKRGEAELERWRADKWLRENGPEFQFVCESAGLDADFVSEKYRAGKISRMGIKKIVGGTYG